jgi:hypothetical protein
MASVLSAASREHKKKQGGATGRGVGASRGATIKQKDARSSFLFRERF